MSDDRMDRAERIRNMREGNRGTADDQADTEPDESETELADGTERADDTPSTGPVDDTERADDTPSTGPVDDTERADDTPSTGPVDDTERTDDATTTVTDDSAGRQHTGGRTDTQSTPATEGGTDGASAADADEDDEATAAAQRAAASAAEVMGGGTDTAGAGDAVPETGDTSDAGGSPGNIAQAPVGVELPDQELLEAAMSDATATSTEGGARAAAVEGQTAQSEELVRVLEFSLGDEYYCLDIEYVEEIVKRSAVTRVPNTPAFVDGVVDLRGQITTILEPKEMMDIDSEGDQNLIVVFDPDKFEEQGAVGWVVDEVRQVVPVTESEVNSPPVDAEYINGIVDREEYDQFVIWVEPDDALAQATGIEEE